MLEVEHICPIAYVPLIGSPYFLGNCSSPYHNGTVFAVQMILRQCQAETQQNHAFATKTVLCTRPSKPSHAAISASAGNTCSQVGFCSCC